MRFDSSDDFYAYRPRPRGIWGGPVYEEALYFNPEDYLSEDERARIEDEDEPF